LPSRPKLFVRCRETGIIDLSISFTNDDHGKLTLPHSDQARINRRGSWKVADSAMFAENGDVLKFQYRIANPIAKIQQVFYR
jgi:hypothetical protein